MDLWRQWQQYGAGFTESPFGAGWPRQGAGDARPMADQFERFSQVMRTYLTSFGDGTAASPEAIAQAFMNGLRALFAELPSWAGGVLDSAQASFTSVPRGPRARSDPRASIALSTRNGRMAARRPCAANPAHPLARCPARCRTGIRDPNRRYLVRGANARHALPALQPLDRPTRGRLWAHGAQRSVLLRTRGGGQRHERLAAGDALIDRGVGEVPRSTHPQRGQRLDADRIERLEAMPRAVVATEARTVAPEARTVATKPRTVATKARTRARPKRRSGQRGKRS